MGTTVFANCMGISHKNSGGKSIVFPDICLTPVGPAVVPIPYPNLAQSSDIANGSVTVKIDGQMATIKDCNYSKSTGDEPGTNNGVASGKIQGKAEFIIYSFDVKIEGKNACRMGDTMTHNNKNTIG